MIPVLCRLHTNASDFPFQRLSHAMHQPPIRFHTYITLPIKDWQLLQSQSLCKEAPTGFPVSFLSD